MRYYMQQKIPCKSCEKKQSEKIDPGITETDRCGKCSALLFGDHPPERNPESQNACREKCVDNCNAAGGHPDKLKSGSVVGFCIGLIRFYRYYISPCFPPCCRFRPTCSAYAISALQIHGLLKGSLLTIWRILRCNPFFKGGYDPVPQKGAWRPVNSDKDL